MEEKSLVWVGSSKKDLLSLPKDIIDDIGYALHDAQIGKKHDNTKALKGFGSAKVIEIKVDDKAGTYRCVYTTKFSSIIFVLHAFQKKSKSGIATPKRDIDLIKSRLNQAGIIYKEINKK